MTQEDRDRLVQLKRKSKTVGNLTREELAFVLNAFETEPEVFKEVDCEVQEWASDWKNWV